MSIQQALLDEKAWEFVCNALTTPELWERQLMRRNDAAEQEALTKRKENLQETVKRLDKKRLNYLQTLGEQEKESTRSWLSTQIKELDIQIEDLKQQVQSIDEQAKVEKKQMAAVQSLADQIRRAETNLATLSLERKRQLLYGLRVQVRVKRKDDPERATIELGGIKSFAPQVLVPGASLDAVPLTSSEDRPTYVICAVTVTRSPM